MTQPEEDELNQALTNILNRFSTLKAVGLVLAWDGDEPNRFLAVGKQGMLHGDTLMLLESLVAGHRILLDRVALLVGQADETMQQLANQIQAAQTALRG